MMLESYALTVENILKVMMDSENIAQEIIVMS